MVRTLYSLVPYVGKIHCYLATKPEVEGFRDQKSVLPEVESLRVQSLWLFKNALPSREEPDISLSILNSKARFYTHALRAYVISSKRGTVHVVMILYVCILNV